MEHWAQVHDKERATEFDYGRVGNLLHYGRVSCVVNLYANTYALLQLHAREYELEGISNKKIALFYSPNDAIADDGDVAWLKYRLQVPLLDDYKVTNKKFNHFDFVTAIDTNKYINPQAIYLLLKSDDSFYSLVQQSG